MPSVEIEQEQEVANALVELSKPSKMIHTFKFIGKSAYEPSGPSGQSLSRFL